MDSPTDNNCTAFFGVLILTWIGSRLYAYKYQKTDMDICKKK